MPMPCPHPPPRMKRVPAAWALEATAAQQADRTESTRARRDSTACLDTGTGHRLRSDTNSVMALRKASEVFVECLEAEGVKYVFGIPGEETLDLNESLADSSVQFVPVRHEQGGAYMADAYGRLTGRAGVCLGTLGPGATNLVTAVADAFLDR